MKLLFRKADGAVAEAAADAEHAPPIAKPQPKSVLVIDDDPDVRGFIVATSKSMDYLRAEASDGASGIPRACQAQS